MLAFIALAILLGTILDSVSIMVITLPFAVPVVKALGGDLIWFGIVATVAVEMGLLTPFVLVMMALLVLVPALSRPLLELDSCLADHARPDRRFALDLMPMLPAPPGRFSTVTV